MHGSTIANKPLVRSLLLSFAVLAGIALLVWFGVEQWYQTSLEPRTAEAEEVAFAVTPGTSLLEVANELEEREIIRSATAFVWYMNRQDGDAVLQAGTYSISASQSTPEIASMFIAGDIDHTLITIPPGYRLDELVDKVFVPAGYDRAEVERALQQRYTSGVLVDKPSRSSLEGYLYPETFQITVDSTPESIIQRALEEFTEQLTPTIRDGLKKQGLSLHEGVILASIVQKEAYDTEDQRKVAQVFLKRLEEGMELGADATFEYGAAVEGGEPTPELDSPYNTRRNAGLPPGPIANFNLSALEAVANPADTDYLYFVHGDGCHDEDPGTDCTTHFANTIEEHEANVDRYCRSYCRGL